MTDRLRTSFRIATWNMAAGFGFDEARHDRAWRYLCELDPDVALVQEVVVPTWAADHWSSIVAAPKYRSQPWASAIVARDLSLEAFVPHDNTPWLREVWGGTVVARTIDRERLGFASIHSNAYPLRKDRLMAGPVEGMRRCHEEDLWEVEVVVSELETLFGNSRFVAGGDLNSALLFDTNYGYSNNARLFGNLSDAGFTDLRMTNEEQQTFFRAGSGPYQLDHMFSDVETAALPHSWRVLPYSVHDLQLSDHAPIEVVVQLETETRAPRRVQETTA